MGYSINKDGVALLFWSGQSFAIDALKAVGKHKVAKLIFKDSSEIKLATFKKLLNDATAIQWNYKDIVKTKVFS